MPPKRFDDLGPFFTVETHAPGATATGPWASFASTLDGASVIDNRIERVRAALALGAGREADDIELRVAASVAHLGVVARIIAPMIAASTLQQPFSLAGSDMWWCDELGGPFPLSVLSVESSTPTTSLDVVDRLGQTIAERCGVSTQVLNGNVASAANSAAKMIGAARPELAERARAAADAILRLPHIEDGALRAGPDFRRRSCCLIYRVAGSRAAICGDCVLG